jgi:hypothetical protein
VCVCVCLCVCVCVCESRVEIIESHVCCWHLTAPSQSALRLLDIAAESALLLSRVDASVAAELGGLAKEFDLTLRAVSRDVHAAREALRGVPPEAAAAAAAAGTASSSAAAAASAAGPVGGSASA